MYKLDVEIVGNEFAAELKFATLWFKTWSCEYEFRVKISNLLLWDDGRNRPPSNKEWEVSAQLNVKPIHLMQKHEGNKSKLDLGLQ